MEQQVCPYFCYETKFVRLPVCVVVEQACSLLGVLLGTPVHSLQPRLSHATSRSVYTDIRAA